MNVSRHMRALIFAIALTVSLWGAQSRAADDEDLPPSKWPMSVSDTVTDIVGRMSDEEKRRLRATKKDDLIMFHHGWGTGIRNRYGLWRGNDQLITSACGKPCHPDDASMVIIEAVWTALQK